MDLNYDVKSWDVSLEIRCAVKLAYQILLESVVKKSAPYDCNVNKKAISRVEQLCLPVHLKVMVMDLIPQFLNELSLWYHYLPVDILPVFTAHGNVDWWQSSKNIVDDETVEKHIRYVVACLFCHEEKIFELGRSMSSAERENVRIQCRNHEHDLSGYFKEFTDLWLHETTQIENGGLSQMDYTGGLITAIEHGNGHAMKFFIGKLTSDVAGQIVINELTIGNIKFCYEYPFMSPEAYCLMYSILSKEHQPSALGDFSHKMLSALLRFPYQRHFITAAQSLVTHLSVEAYWDILNDIVWEIESGMQNHDYIDTYFKFWDISTNLIGDKRFVREYCPVMFDSILSSNERVLINHLLIEISDKGRDMLLLYFVEKHISFASKFACQSRYWFLDMFIRSCSMKRKHTLLKFKEDFMRNINSDPEINAAVRNRKIEIIDGIVGKILEELQLEETVVSHSASLNQFTPALIEEWLSNLKLSESLLSS